MTDKAPTQSPMTEARLVTIEQATVQEWNDNGYHDEVIDYVCWLQAENERLKTQREALKAAVCRVETVWQKHCKGHVEYEGDLCDKIASALKVVERSSREAAMSEPMTNERLKELELVAPDTYEECISWLHEAVIEIRHLRAENERLKVDKDKVFVCGQELQEENERMMRDGKLRRCDIPACNCNGFHSEYASRMLELADKYEQALYAADERINHLR
jgi:hypothetical protein